MLYGLYVKAGRLLFKVLLPIMRIFIRRTHRVYALIIKSDQVLLTKNWLGDGKWALPGGGVGRRESSEQALKRELEEELSLEVNQGLEFLVSGIWQEHRFGFKYDIYRLTANPEFRVNRKLEITDVAWIDIARLDTSTASSDLLAALKKL